MGIAWGECVIIDLPDLDGVQIVWHPAYAAHLLIDSWPVDHGRAYGAAINACQPLRSSQANTSPRVRHHAVAEVIECFWLAAVLASDAVEDGRRDMRLLRNAQRAGQGRSRQWCGRGNQCPSELFRRPSSSAKP